MHSIPASCEVSKYVSGLEKIVGKYFWAARMPATSYLPSFKSITVSQRNLYRAIHVQGVGILYRAVRHDNSLSSTICPSSSLSTGRNPFIHPNICLLQRRVKVQNWVLGDTQLFRLVHTPTQRHFRHAANKHRAGRPSTPRITPFNMLAAKLSGHIACCLSAME